MQTHIYKSTKRADTYVYLGKADDFDCLPQALRQQLGGFVKVMELQLHAQRKLAREDVHKVMENITTRGFHLQFPPSQATDPMLEDYGTDA